MRCRYRTPTTCKEESELSRKEGSFFFYAKRRGIIGAWNKKVPKKGEIENEDAE